ncbi:MAG: hypothetical protein V4568_10765 [Pseudomonadota bacterium]
MIKHEMANQSRHIKTFLLAAFLMAGAMVQSTITNAQQGSATLTHYTSYLNPAARSA